jgi:5-formyltetrahydrofolate cyclo-ligase
VISKNDLRQSALESRRAISHDRLVAMSKLVAKNLAALHEFRDAKLIASYVSKDYEVQTSTIIQGLLAEGKRVIVPLVDTSSSALLFFEIHSLDELRPGRFGIPEPANNGAPVSLSESSLLLVPLLAWDDRGHRIGYGRGYFDKALASRGSSIAVGLALESQKVAMIPETSSDVPLDTIVTEERVVRFRGRSI